MKAWIQRRRKARREVVRERVASPRLFELDDERDEGRVVELGQFLVDQGWPANAFTAHAVVEFERAVRRRYVEVRGVEPPRAHGGWVYRGYADWLLVMAVYEESIGVLAEQLAHENVPGSLSSTSSIAVLGSES